MTLYPGIRLSLAAGALGLLLTACGGDDNDDDITALQQQVADLQTEIDALAMADSDLSTTLADLSAQLEALEARSVSDEELAALSMELEALTEHIEALQLASQTWYEITLTNLSANQPLAPAALILHDMDYRGWMAGMPASAGLELLAESGSPADFLAEADSPYASMGGGAILMPGEQVTYSLSTNWQPYLALTVASMPVNTNDAFAGVTGWAIGGLLPGDSVSTHLHVYDAGTEANTETAETIPGPAAGGEGYNAARDDLVDAVALHRGVVSADDGYAESALDQSHRFDQGMLAVTVLRR